PRRGGQNICYSGSAGGCGKCSSVSSGSRPAKYAGQYGGQGEKAGSATGAADQIAARELPCAAKATAGSGGYVQPELSDSRKRSVARSAIRSIPLVSSGTAR